MSSKKRGKTGAQTYKRGTSRAKPRRTGAGTYALIVGAVLLAVGVVVVLVLLDRGQTGTAEPAATSQDKSMGAADAPVVVLEFADFQCPYCRQFAAETEQQLREEYVATGQVRFVYRHFAFIGDESVWAAEASECANEQGRFWDYHDKLFEEQGAENSGAFSQDNLKRFAAELGLDTTQFNTCFDSGKYRDKVVEENTEAQRRRVSGTPTVLVNEKVVPNGSVYQVLKTAIEAALAGE